MVDVFMGIRLLGAWHKGPVCAVPTSGEEACKYGIELFEHCPDRRADYKMHLDARPRLGEYIR